MSPRDLNLAIRNAPAVHSVGDVLRKGSARRRQAVMLSARLVMATLTAFAKDGGLIAGGRRSFLGAKHKVVQFVRDLPIASFRVDRRILLKGSR